MTVAHPHPHPHEDGHDHVLTVRESPESPESPVQDVGANPVLDIGGDVGALVVVLARQTASGELEACPTSAPAARFHTGVHRRGEGDLAAWTAVFPTVQEGRYHLLHDDGTPMATVDVTGGRVETVDLR